MIIADREPGPTVPANPRVGLTEPGGPARRNHPTVPANTPAPARPARTADRARRGRGSILTVRLRTLPDQPPRRRDRHGEGYRHRPGQAPHDRELGSMATGTGKTAPPAAPND